MPDGGLDTAVVLLVYNRPELTREVFRAISEARPRRLYIVADGPKDGNDARGCDAARSIVSDVRWPCDVRRNFSDVHMGLRNRPATGISWVFEQEREAIILEDDCVPHASFFRYAAELLAHYRDDERIMHIGGSNQLLGRRAIASSYFFSRYPHVWGWATWKRAWKHYDPMMRAWPDVRESGAMNHLWKTAAEREFWRRAFDRVYAGRTVTWDVQWTFATWLQSALAIVPGVNLVSNIGFGADATNTRDDSALAALPTADIGALRHPSYVFRDDFADQILWETSFKRSVLDRAVSFARRRFTTD